MFKSSTSLSRRRALQLSAGAAGGAVLGTRATRWASAAQESGGTLSMWDSWSEAGASSAVDKMVELFLANHPGLEVEREVYDGMQIRDVIRTALGANTGPDLICYDISPVTLWILVDANELAPMDEAYEQFGWDETVFETAQQWASVDGVRYALPHSFEFEPVFYNKTIYDELGLSVPTTHAEFVSNCEAVADAGYIPITLGNAGSGELRHVFGFPLNNLLGSEKMADLLLCGGSWDQPEVHEAIKIIAVDYQEKGFYPEFANGIQSQDAMNLFLSGQAAHRLLGSWIIGSIADAGMADQIDIFLYPSVDGSEVLPQTWFGSGYEVAADSENKELALDLLSVMFSPEGIKIWVEEANQVPCMPFDASGMNMNPLMQKALGMLQDDSQAKGWMLPSIVPATFYDMMNVGFQQILAGEKTVEQQVADLQTAWQEDIDSGAYPVRCE